MHPEFFQLGPLQVRAFGVMLVLSFGLGLWILARRAPRAGFDTGVVFDLVQVILVGSLVGARAAYVIAHWDAFAGQPLRALAVWEGGMTYYGGAVVATAGAVLWIRHRGLSVLRLGDVVAPTVALGEGITRIGCFLNGCCFGRACTLPWAVRFPPGSFAQMELGPVDVHPTQLYQSAWGFLVAAILFAMGLKRRPGTVWWSLVLLLPLGRAAVDFVRYYDYTGMIHLGGITMPQSQLVSLVLAAVGAAGLLLGRKRTR